MEIKDFESYLKDKKIDSDAFKKGQPEQWSKFKVLYDQMHPNSFTAQKLFLINPIRRAFPLKEEVQEKATPTAQARPKVMMRPKPKTN
ncbi:hypothetical protein EV198_2311 [Roseivirga ehrenbergii]|uniref:hypothetical protein n=1 Tax=Roseivirga ehrenbergii (strain DSM 102268 / JCM 13514 / KCTC 12282 / NCIMB 14502 / KMM 6017) TaxID=279360 RepID=UPI000A87E6F4|nr:hypothetical protein [Roseivirga ehrenbergii]TCL07876.1 hypothetical protein EV198_2311 [Roseivirga ehrenbergii]